MRKTFIFSAILSMALTLPVFAAPDGVVTTTANIGGGNAKLVYIDMSPQNRAAEAKISSQMQPASAQTLINSVSDGTVVAAMNGGFFNAYYKPDSVNFPDNYPRVYGTVISNGEILNGGNVGAPGLVFDRSGKPSIGQVGVSTYLYVNGEERRITSVNNIDSQCFTPYFKAPKYVPAGDSVTYIQNGVVTGNVVSEGVSIGIPEGTTVLVGVNGLNIGDRVEVGYKVTLNGEEVDADTVMTCGPMILQNGEKPEAGGSYDEKQASTAVNQKSFAAIAPDGRLILGKVVSSNSSIGDYLLSIGVKNAMSLDGGASSMLYVKNVGYLQNAGRNLANVFMIVDKTKPVGPVPLYPSAADITIGGSRFTLSAYNIDGSNYFKLRDIAYIAANSSMAFDVGYDEESKTVSIDSVPSGSFLGEAPGNYSDSVNYKKSASPIIANGISVTADAYNIDGSNYFKLRDITDIFGKSVSYDNETKAISISAQ